MARIKICTTSTSSECRETKMQAVRVRIGDQRICQLYQSRVEGTHASTVNCCIFDDDEGHSHRQVGVEILTLCALVLCVVQASVCVTGSEQCVPVYLCTGIISV